MKYPFDANCIPSPCFVVDAERLRENGRLLEDLRKRTGAKILLALKAFAMPSALPILKPFLDGTTASSVSEALLGRLHLGKEVHAYAVAYSPKDFIRLCSLSHHVTVNSLSQWQTLKPHSVRYPQVQFGLRINPQYSEVEVDIYNSCLPGSRFGMTIDDIREADLSGLSGLHVHTCCEQGVGPLERTVDRVEADFGTILHRMKWLNLGGGHHITKPDYDRSALISLIKRLRDTYDLEVILEPGEAVVQEAGWLVATVLDAFTSQETHHAILDVSATAHMPDTLEMPYRAEVLNAGNPGEKSIDIRLGGTTCMAGDSFGTYSFDEPLQAGDRLVFPDAAMYTMVKTTHFNGVPHPAIALWDDGRLHLTKTFGYADVRNRLG